MQTSTFLVACLTLCGSFLVQADKACWRCPFLIMCLYPFLFSPLFTQCGFLLAQVNEASWRCPECEGTAAEIFSWTRHVPYPLPKPAGDSIFVEAHGYVPPPQGKGVKASVKKNRDEGGAATKGKGKNGGTPIGRPSSGQKSSGGTTANEKERADTDSPDPSLISRRGRGRPKKNPPLPSRERDTPPRAQSDCESPSLRKRKRILLEDV